MVIVRVKVTVRIRIRVKVRVRVELGLHINPKTEGFRLNRAGSKDPYRISALNT